jgi:Skp family chaperone for outer membrane proteins
MDSANSNFIFPKYQKLANYLIISILLIFITSSLSFAQTNAALEKAKIEIKKLQERLQNANEEVVFYQRRLDSLQEKLKELEALNQELEAENQSQQEVIDSLTLLNQKQKEANAILQKELQEKNQLIHKLQKTLEPIVENHTRANSYLKADSLALTIKACYLLVPDKTPPQRLVVKIECWDLSNRQMLFNQDFKIKIDQIPAELDAFVAGQQTDTGNPNEESYCFYYNGTQKISHSLRKGKYEYRLYVNNSFIKKETFEL